MAINCKQLVEENIPLLIEIRRFCHRHPELSWQETQTMAYIEEDLTKFGIAWQHIDKGGILARIDGQAPGKTLLLRADIDALPITESESNLSCPRVVRSETPGVMHACGHDGHIAMQLVVAKLLQETKDQWNGTAAILFEQGEEDSPAMRYIVPYLEEKSGLSIDSCYATHLRWDVPVGKVAICDNAPMAGGFRFRVRIAGKGGHGSRPDLAYSPIDCFTSFHTHLQELRLRAIAPQECLTVSVGSVHSGELQNVVPDSLEFAGTCRFFSYDHAGRRFFDEFFRLLSNDCDTYHCTYDILDMPKPLYEVQNNPVCVDLAKKAVTETLGAGSLTQCEPWMASETFAILTRLYPGLMTFTGIANPEKGSGANHHTPQFDLDEDALAVGATTGLAYALEFFKTQPDLPFERTDEPLNELAARNV